MRLLSALVISFCLVGCAHEPLTCDTHTPPTAKIRVKPAGSFVK